MNISTASIAAWYYFYVLGDNKKQISYIHIMFIKILHSRQWSNYSPRFPNFIYSVLQKLMNVVVLPWVPCNCSPKKRHRYGTFTGKNPRTWSIFMVDVHGFSILMCWVGGESPFFPSNAELFSSWAWSQLFLLDSIWIPSPDFTGFYGDFISRFHRCLWRCLRLSSLFHDHQKIEDLPRNTLVWATLDSKKSCTKPTPNLDWTPSPWMISESTIIDHHHPSFMAFGHLFSRV